MVANAGCKTFLHVQMPTCEHIADFFPFLTERCYVPLLRDTDNSFQPVIGLPWSPSPLEVDFHSQGSGVAGSPIDPVMTVRAYVGPLSPSKVTSIPWSIVQ